MIGQIVCKNTPSIRHQYEMLGAKEFYRTQGEHYRNPHEAAVGNALSTLMGRSQMNVARALDLACGSGEITLALHELLPAAVVDGVDPYTQAAYLARTGKVARGISFEDIAGGALAGQRYDLIVCSFALHLVESSRLPMVAWALAQIARRLVILTPHKRPHLEERWGWQLTQELVVDRVRARHYLSCCGAC